jgi:putative aminopeptidase FrvX
MLNIYLNLAGKRKRKMKTLQLIEKLSNLHGAPGHEDEVTDFVRDFLSGMNFERDCMNNLFVRRKKVARKSPVVALDCHSDEVGFIVENINSNGTISFLTLGRWHEANIPAHAVLIKNFKGEYVKGVVATKPPHFMSEEERMRLPKIEDLVIDLGTRSYEETVDLYSIEVGNPITPDVSFVYEPRSGVMRGKAFDNRLGCAAVSSIMASLKNLRLPVEPVGVFCSQEEGGLRGAQVAARQVKPDFALVFEGCPADDTFKDKAKAHGIIGKGIQFRVLDAGMVSNPRVQAFARKIAEENNIPWQVIARSNGQTNAARYHLVEPGIPTLVVGIPARYIHTHYSFAALDDPENAILFGRKFLEAINQKVISEF